MGVLCHLSVSRIFLTNKRLVHHFMLFPLSLKRLNILQMVNKKRCLLLVRGVSDDLI